LGYNNPAEQGYEEVLWGENYYKMTHQEKSLRGLRATIPTPIKLFLSIGTGGDDENQRPEGSSGVPPRTLNKDTNKRKRARASLHKHLENLAYRLQRQAIEVSRVDRRMRVRSLCEGWPYFRWAGGKDLAKHKLDKWEPAKSGSDGTQADIQKWIREYMNDPLRQEEVKGIAQTLVNIRRQRVQHEGGDRWQRFAYCSYIPCPKCHTKDYRVTGTKAKLETHVKGCSPSDSTIQRVAPKVVGGPW
jgi:hypothetical protein